MEEKFYFRLKSIKISKLKNAHCSTFIICAFCDLISLTKITIFFSRINYIRCYYRYVVDISFMLIPRKKIDEVSAVFNSFDNWIEFTYEKETNRQLSFLDFNVTYQGDTIITNLYHKRSYSGRILNFMFNHPLHKKNQWFSNWQTKLYFFQS